MQTIALIQKKIKKGILLLECLSMISKTALLTKIGFQQPVPGIVF